MVDCMPVIASIFFLFHSDKRVPNEPKLSLRTFHSGAGALQGAFGLWMGKEYSFSCGSEFSGNPGKKKFCESAGGCVLYKSGRGKG